ncbi:MAG: hypothetical protein NTU43_02425 [Bacteroidetes bacterium]|nr:hypothetical protein [Bacteroidota bacterium]
MHLRTTAAGNGVQLVTSRVKYCIIVSLGRIVVIMFPIGLGPTVMDWQGIIPPVLKSIQL